MIIIRLQRTGKKNQASFRLVLMEKTKKAKGEFIENLGFYSPFTKKGDFKADRIKYWISQGAQISDNAYNLLIKNNILNGKKRNVVKIKKSEIKKEVKTETV